MWSEIYNQADPCLFSFQQDSFHVSGPCCEEIPDPDPDIQKLYGMVTNNDPSISTHITEIEEYPNHELDKASQLYQSASVFLDNYRQGVHRLWYITNWFYRLESHFSPDQLPYIAFIKDYVTQDQYNYALIFLPLTYEEYNQALSKQSRSENEKIHSPCKLDTEQSMKHGYPFAKWSDEYQKWIFINPEPNETPSRQCVHCQQPVIIGYRCNTCNKNAQSMSDPILLSNAMSICTSCSINSVHENQYGQNHGTQLVYARHCERYQITFNHNLIIMPMVIS